MHRPVFLWVAWRRLHGICVGLRVFNWRFALRFGRFRCRNGDRFFWHVGRTDSRLTRFRLSPRRAIRARSLKVASEPDALLAVLKNPAYHFKRIGLDAGPPSQWLFSALAEAGFPVICVETRHMRAVLKADIATRKNVHSHSQSEPVWLELTAPIRHAQAASITVARRPPPHCNCQHDNCAGHH